MSKKKTAEDILSLIGEIQDEITYVTMRVVFEDGDIYDKDVVAGSEFTQLYSPGLDRVFHATYVGKSPAGQIYIRFEVHLDADYDIQWLKDELVGAEWQRTSILQV